ncbi:MAG: hypothetical protein GC204_05260 [Chloroflexi bacterium]|nr:hypothetical protein [Chloroflexota bacterium]
MWWVLAALLILLAACGSGGTGEMHCTTANGRETCSGTLDQLSGANTLRFDLHELNGGNPVQMQITVRVKTGAVTVRFVDAAGKAISQDVSREMPLTLTGRVAADAQVTLSSTHGISTEVSYAAEFTP